MQEQARLDFPSPNNPSWNSLTAISVWFLSVFLIVFLPYVFLVPYLRLKNISGESSVIQEFIKADTTAIILNLVAVIPAHILTLLVCWVIITDFGKYSFRQTVGWDLDKIGFSQAIFFVALFNAVAILLFYFFPEPESDLMKVIRSSPQALYLTAFIAVSTAPVVEEVVYRGILYSALQKKFGMSAAITIVTTLFALVHVPQYFPSYVTILLIFTLSFVLTLIRAYSGSLLPCILIHALHNLTQASILILQSILQKN